MARALLAARSEDASICPSEVVRRLWREGAPHGQAGDGWRAWMPAIRGVAADLAGQGILRVTRGDRELGPVDARDGRGGPIRLRRGPRFPPSPDDNDSPADSRTDARTDARTDPAG